MSSAQSQSSTHLTHSEPVLEVAQTVGDTVNSVHLLSASESKPRLSRRALAAIGVACLLLSALAFGRGVSVAATNDAALHQWVSVERKPMMEFRPVRLSLAHDVVAFGGLAAALICFGGALAIRRRLPSSLRAGSADTDSVAWADHPSFELASVTSGAATISLPVDVIATVTDAEGKTREARGQVVLGESESARAPLGVGQVHFRWTGKPRRAAIGAGFSLDSRTSKFIAASAIVHLAALALLLTIPPESRSMNTDTEIRYVPLSFVRTDANEDKRPEPDKGKSTGEQGPAKMGMATSSSEGAKGTPDAPKVNSKAAIKHRSDEPHLANPRPRDMRDVGIVGLLNEDHFIAFNQPKDFASGDALDDMIGNDFNGSASGPGFGPGGMWGSPNGKGISPYGGDFGTVRAGFIPGGGPTGEDYGSKFSGTGKLARGHVSRDPHIKFKQANCGVAGCDKALIGRYIRKHKRRIRNCYERALIGDSDLSGTVVARFLIHPNGRVASARASGIGNSKLESCVAGVVASINFPVVADGAVASVSYPFVMSQAGQ